MGFEMISIIGEVRNRINYHELNMRIGIHTVIDKFIIKNQGSIIGGVIGTDIIRYDIYG